MSQFFDQASLVMVPSGYKDGKVYSQKPLTTDGQLTFSRSTTATRVNSAGLIEEVAANVPRLDYLGSSCPRLLLEPQRTNTITFSENFDNAAWVKQTDTTISSNATTSPDGYTNADKLVNSTSVNRQAIYQNSSLTGVVSFSVFAKKAEYDVIQLTDGRQPSAFANFDLTNGVLGSFVGFTASIQDYGNGWYRCAVSADYGALTINQPRISLAQTPTEARLVEFAGSGTDGAFIYGAQVEAGAYATSYIPTLGATVTRGAETASKTGISSLIGSVGTLFVQMKAFENGFTSRRISLSDGTLDNRVTIEYDEIASRIRGFIIGAGVASSNLDADGYDQTNSHKIALVYNNATLKIFIDGVLAASTAATMVPTGMDRITTFTASSSSNYLFAELNQLLLFTTALSDADAIALTA